MADEPESGSRTRVLLIVGGVLLGLALLGCIVCAAGGALCAQNLPSQLPREPARYEAYLYYGTWTGEGPTTLTIDSSSVHWDHTGPSGHVQYNGGFGGISGQNILVNVLVTDVPLVVSQPPAVDPTTGRWTMVVEGIRLEHP